MNTHHVQLAEQLQAKASEYINTWSNRQSMITITSVQLSRSADKVTFCVSVYPEDAEGPALGFLMRKRSECRDYLKTHVALGRIPHVDFVLDEGEKNRQKVESLLEE